MFLSHDRSGPVGARARSTAASEASGDPGEARRTVRHEDAAAGLVPVRPRRRPWLIAAGALLASVGALAVVWLVGAAGQRQEVLALRQAVPYGQALAAEDLAVVRVSVDPGVATMPAGSRNTVVGQVAATALAPGMLLAPAMVRPTGEPAAGRVLVPVAIPAERMPAQGLRAGDRILVVSPETTVAGPGDGTGSAGGPAAGVTSAIVVRVGPPDVNGVSVVDVTTAPGAGPALAAASAAGQVALVVQPVGG